MPSRAMPAHTLRTTQPEAEAQLDDGEQGLFNNLISTYRWKDLTVSVKGGKNGSKKLLDRVSGEARAGSLVALMGPSGSGKTTLLNVLARRPTPGLKSQGQLFIDEKPVPALPEFNALSSFVEQEDRLIGSLTARETVDFAARMASTRFASHFAKHGVHRETG